MKAGDLVPYVRQLHEAKKAGRHYDVRLGKDKMFSWATRKEMPKPGEQIAMYPQPLHNEPYMHFQGRIGRGYGAGHVRTADKGEVQILKASPNNIKFAMAHTGEPEVFNMVRINGKDKPFWLVTNQTPTEAVAEKKLHYTKIPAEKIDKLMDPKYVMSAKIDGAAAFARMMKDHVDVLSYRTSKEGKPIMHTQRMQVPEKVNIPKELQNKVFRGEIYGEQGGKTIPAAKLGGLLNSSLANSIRRQQNEKIKLKMALFGATDPNSPEKWAARPREQVRAEVLGALQHLPKGIFTEPPYAYTPEEKMKMWEDIKSGKNPLTREGVVGFPAAGGTPAKAVVTPEYDVVVRNIFPAVTKSGDKRAGGFGYSLPGRKDVVGKVGTGFTHEVLKDMIKNPDKYIGRTARVTAKEQFPSGALRAPSYSALHEDIPKVANILERTSLIGPKENLPAWYVKDTPSIGSAIAQKAGGGIKGAAAGVAPYLVPYAGAGLSAADAGINWKNMVSNVSRGNIGAGFREGLGMIGNGSLAALGVIAPGGGGVVKGALKGIGAGGKWAWNAIRGTRNVTKFANEGFMRGYMEKDAMARPAAQAIYQTMRELGITFEEAAKIVGQRGGQVTAQRTAAIRRAAEDAAQLERLKKPYTPTPFPVKEDPQLPLF